MRVLEAWWEGRHVGVFTEADDRVVFEYDSDAPDTPISLSLPRDRPATKRAPQTFLDNLLPDDSRVRARIASVTEASGTDVFSLLEKVGGDVAGALILTPGDQVPGETEDPVYPATDDEIAFRISALKRDPSLWVGRETPERFSLAGTQAKFALAFRYNRWFWSTASLPSTHILKPGNPQHAEMEQLEAASMALARASGLSAPEASTVEFFGQTAYIVTRFDRKVSRGRTIRIHTEDFAQACGMGPDQKHHLSAPQALQMLKNADPGLELSYQFVRQLAFNTLLGNADAHAKNYSLMLRPNGIELSPMYDLLPTTYWPQYDSGLAMQIGGAKRSQEITPGHWRKLAIRCGLDSDRVVTEVQVLAHAAVKNSNTAWGGLPDSISIRLRELVERNTARVLAERLPG